MMFSLVLQYTLRECSHMSSKFYRSACNVHNFKHTKYERCECDMISKHSYRSYSLSIPSADINLKNKSLARYVSKIEDEYQRNLFDRDAVLSIETDRGKLEKMIGLVKSFREIESNVGVLKEMMNDCKDEKELNSVEEELAMNEKELLDIEAEIVDVLLPTDEDEKCSEIVMEVIPGVGGQESTLFAKELYDLYCSYLKFTGWNFDVVEEEENGIGGIKTATIMISGNNSFKYLRFEGGVHQVQRVPKTEKGGRMHTSTASVAVYPRPSEVDVIVKDEDLEWEAKTARGPGGQHVNKIQTAVRLTHLPTGLVTECQVSRSHNENRKIALRKLYLKLFQIESDKKFSSVQATRKVQIKNKCRNEKARTYNFPQNRITDHRFKKTINNIPRFFEGEEYFHDFLEEISELHRVERIEKFLESLKNT